MTRLRRVLGVDHPDTLDAAANLAARLAWLGKHAQACALAEDTLTRVAESWARITPTPTGTGKPVTPTATGPKV